MTQNSSNDIQKYLDKIVKMQQNQENIRQEEFRQLIDGLNQMTSLLSDMIRINATGSTVAATKKVIPFQTGSQLAGQLLTQPTNPDNYPTIINLYAQNDNRPIQHMTLINDGPGELFFVVGYSKTDVNTQEGKLNVNDQRELFNVYEVRLRSTLPLTTFRLIEGISRTGSFAPQTKANVEIRPTVQSNESIKQFDAIFESVAPITITQPTIQNFPAIGNPQIIQTPIPPGRTATLRDTSNGSPMPFNIPAGFVLEIFAVDVNMTTDFTTRVYFRFPTIPAYILNNVFPASSRGLPLNFILNLSTFTTGVFFPLGAPPGGIDFLITITNDDPFNNLIGEVDVTTILRRVR